MVVAAVRIDCDDIARNRIGSETNSTPKRSRVSRLSSSLWLLIMARHLEETTMILSTAALTLEVNFDFLYIRARNREAHVSWRSGMPVSCISSERNDGALWVWALGVEIVMNRSASPALVHLQKATSGD